ncbi:MAG TPA: Gldg family protein [Candidatus Obscuribacterales bacterium]
MKGITFSSKWLKFLTWPGLACLTAGLVAGGLSGWQWVPTALLLLGVGLILLGLSFSGATAGAFWQRRSTQAGTNAAIATLAVLIILGLVNFLVVQNAPRFDLTETQLFSLAPASQQIAQRLEQPVRLVIFDTAQNPRDVQLLESYQQASNNFRFEYIDPFANPTVAQSFGATQAGMVYLEVGEERRFLQTIGVTANPNEAGNPVGLSEQQITNALDQIVSDRRLTVYFVQGHGEPPIDGSEAGLGQAVQSLEEKAYAVRPLNLAESQTVPADANVVVVAGPAQDFFPAEVDALESYLAGGGGLLLLLDPRADAGLSPLLDEWGVILDDRLVLDTSGAGQFVGLGPAAPIVTDYGDHPITQAFGEGRSFFPLARPVESRELPDTTATPILLTNAQSRAEAITDDGNLNFDPNAPADGPYVLGVALSRAPEAAPVPSPEADADAGASEDPAETVEDAETAEDAPPESPEATTPEDSTSEAAPQGESRLVVIGNSSFATDGAFNQQLNGDVFLNTVNWLGQEADATLSIRPKTVTDRRMQMTGPQAWGLGIFSLLVLPLTGLALAILMAWQRR